MTAHYPTGAPWDHGYSMACGHAERVSDCEICTNVRKVLMENRGLSDPEPTPLISKGHSGSKTSLRLGWGKALSACGHPEMGNGPRWLGLWCAIICGDSGQFFRGSDDIAAGMRVTERAARKWRATLVSVGWLTPVGKMRGRTPVLQLTWPNCECSTCRDNLAERNAG